jgi:16S rRNA (adenine1518-N6/adenine1519-N6)-dimethyltransferase
VRQKLGQHFLIKGSILERIAAAVAPQRADLVVEIGPGRGALTAKLLDRAERVIAIELDFALAEHLRTRYASEPRLTVIQSDVLEVDLGQWGAAAIAGNLPYYITSPILEHVFRTHFTRAVFLVQKEVAQRIAAKSGSRDYGYLTVETAAFAEARLLFEVKPEAFRPPPRVDSAVVLLEPHAGPVPADQTRAFIKFAGLCFRQKRKMLRNNLAAVFGKEAIEAQPEASLRAEQLTPEGLASLFLRLNALRSGSPL